MLHKGGGNKPNSDRTQTVSGREDYSLFFLTWPLEFAPAQCYYHQFRDNSGARVRKTDCSVFNSLGHAVCFKCFFKNG